MSKLKVKIFSFNEEEKRSHDGLTSERDEIRRGLAGIIKFQQTTRVCVMQQCHSLLIDRWLGLRAFLLLNETLLLGRVSKIPPIRCQKLSDGTEESQKCKSPTFQQVNRVVKNVAMKNFTKQKGMHIKTAPQKHLALTFLFNFLLSLRIPRKAARWCAQTSIPIDVYGTAPPEAEENESMASM